MWYYGTIDILSYSFILYQDWKVLQDVIINCIKDSLYRLTSDVLESPCTISPFYVTGGVSFLLVVHLWYGVMQEVSHIMVKQTSLDNLKCWTMWYMDDKLISVLDFVGHKVIFLDQSKRQDVSYSFGVIPDRVGISAEVIIFFVFVTPVLQCTHIYGPLGESMIFEKYFPLMKGVACLTGCQEIPNFC